jgi:hypothetical protein
MLLLYVEIIEPDPTRKTKALLKGYSHWQVLCSAIAFAGIGLSIAVHKTFHRLARFSALLGAGCLFSVLTWALFFSNAGWPLPIQIFGGLCLALGMAGVIGAQFQAYRGHKTIYEPQNPIDIATTYWRYGRPAQAETLLRKAADEQPHQSQLFLNALETLKKSQ